MARVNRTTGVFLVLGVILLIGTVTGVQAFKSGNGAPVVTDDNAYGPTVFCSGEVAIRSRLSMPAPGIPGRVAAILVNELDKVQGGQVLVQLDDTMARNELRTAEAALLSARFDIDTAKLAIQKHQTEIKLQENAVEAATNLKKMAAEQLREAEKMQKTGVGNDERVNIAATQLANANVKLLSEKITLASLKEATPLVERSLGAADAKVALLDQQVAKARAALDLYAIKAPKNGRVLQLRIGIGEQIGVPTPGQEPPLVFQPDEPLIVRAEVDQERIWRVHEGMRVTLAENSANRPAVWMGTVERISPWIARPRSVFIEPGQINDTRKCECIIRLDPSPDELRLGTRMTVQIHVEPK